MRNSILLFVSVLFVVMLVSPDAPAQSTQSSNDKASLISEFRRLTGADHVNLSLDITLDGTKKEFAAMVDDDKELSEPQRVELRKAVSDATARLEAQLKTAITDKEKINELSEATVFEIYDRTFTESELREAIAFYSTATGQKALKFLRTLNKEYEQAMQAKMIATIGDFIKPKIEAETEQLREKIRKAKLAPAQ